MSGTPGTFVPNANAGGATTGTTFPVSPFLPTSYSQYAGTPVPGLGSAPTPGSAADVALLNAGAPSGYGQVSLSQALNNLLKAKDPKKILEIQQQLIQAGLLNPHDSNGFIAGHIDSSDATYLAYARALTDAIEKHTPVRDLLTGLASDPSNTLGQSYWSAFQADQAAAGSGGATTQTGTSTSLTNGMDARQIAQNQYESMLGRNVTNKEARAFQTALDAYESSNPTTQTQTTNAGGTAQTSTTSGGTNPDQFAEQQILQNHGKEYAQTQGDQIYNLFANLIGSHA